MDSFLLVMIVVAIFGGCLSGIINMSGPRNYPRSRNLFTFLFCDRY